MYDVNVLKLALTRIQTNKDRNNTDARFIYKSM